MKDIKKEVQRWAKAIGYRNAVRRLISNEVSPRAAERLCAGEYPSEPKSIRRYLIEEMLKDGFARSEKENAS